MATEELLTKFAETQQRNEIAEVLKELFEEKKIFLISGLSKDEIKLCTRIYLVADMKNINIYKTGLAFYVKLMLSKDRQSRRELLEAIRGISGHQSFLSKLNPMNWFKSRGNMP